METWIGPAAVLFALGVVFHAGILAQRVTHLEEWRAELRKDLDAFHAALRRIELLIEHHEGN